MKFQAVALMTASILALSACETSTAPRPGLADPYPAPMNSPEITVVDPDLHQWLAFHPATRIRTGGRPLQVEVPTRNLADNAYLIEYRYLFYDENGLQEEPVMGWKGERIDPKQIGFTVDTPVPYRLQDLVSLIDERMGKLENRSSRIIYHKLISRIDTVKNDPRYAFMFDNANVGGDTMAEVISHLFRLPANGRPMTVMSVPGRFFFICTGA